uniref:Uncharacterized protein n=1 Tax=Arundo donax TaxID=35708 RepID=A0A0A9BN56_ARUDO
MVKRKSVSVGSLRRPEQTRAAFRCDPAVRPDGRTQV